MKAPVTVWAPGASLICGEPRGERSEEQCHGGLQTRAAGASFPNFRAGIPRPPRGSGRGITRSEPLNANAGEAREVAILGQQPAQAGFAVERDDLSVEG